MIMIPAFLILAQAMIGATYSNTVPARSSSTVHHHTHPLSTASSAANVKITIVNATSIPEISLEINGRKAYPSFPQGEWTANQAVTNTEMKYEVRTNNGSSPISQKIRFQPLSSQYLVITGDLSTCGPSDKLPQILGNSAQQGAFPQNLQFHVIPYTLVCKDPCHYRFMNAMPGKILEISSLPTEKKPAQRIALLTPGGSILLVNQPESTEYEVKIEGKLIRVPITQEGAEGNCLIPFFLRDGKPDFIRVFEDP